MGRLYIYLQELKSTWHNPYFLVDIDPLLTHLLVSVPSILILRYMNGWFLWYQAVGKNGVNGAPCDTSNRLGWFRRIAERQVVRNCCREDGARGRFALEYFKEGCRVKQVKQVLSTRKSCQVYPKHFNFWSSSDLGIAIQKFKLHTFRNYSSHWLLYPWYRF